MHKLKAICSPLFQSWGHKNPNKKNLGWRVQSRAVGDENLKINFLLPIKQKINNKLELMFMKHYAPNRCLYIKVAKLRTGVGSAEMSHLQNRCLKISG